MEQRISKYAIHLMWSDNDGGYIATCPDFAGLSAFGETPENAISEARAAIGLFIKTYEEDGIPVPDPQGPQHYSGQFRLRIPQSLHAQVARMAASDKISMNQWVQDAIAERVGGQKVHDQMLKEVRRAISNLIVLNNLGSQSVNWPETKVDKLEIEQTVTTAVSVRKTATTKGTTERGN